VWRWGPAGALRKQPGGRNLSGLGVFDLPLRLPGQYFDKESGLHYNYFRDYDPSIGRYGESDPIGLRGGINTFAYVNGNLISFTDPLGLMGQGNYSGVTPGWPAKQLPPPNNPYSGYNWCGPGANAGLPPTNCVDAACQKHDRSGPTRLDSSGGVYKCNPGELRDIHGGARGEGRRSLEHAP
jgi:RHS repeat-associated protein